MNTDGWVIMGSSNISDSGLGLTQPPRYELNVSMKNFDDVDYCHEEFKRLWEEGVPLTLEDIDAFKKKTYLGYQPTPYELFIKVLIDAFGDQVEDDLYEIFIQQGMTILKPFGTMVYINPNTLLSNLNSKNLRKKIITGYGLRMIDNFKMDVFSEPTVHTCIMHYRKGESYAQIAVRKGIETSEELNKDIDFDLLVKDIAATDNYTFDVTIDSEARSIFNKIAVFSKLGELCYLRQCIKTGNDKAYVCKSVEQTTEPWKKTLRGKGIDRYCIKEDDIYLMYGNWLARNWEISWLQIVVN